MTILEQMEARLADLRKQSDALFAERGAILDLAAAEKRGATEAELTSYDEISAKRSAVEREIAPVAERVAELRAAAEREDASAEMRVATGEVGVVRVKSEPAVYRKGDYTQSFFRDLANAKINGNRDALDNLVRHQRQMADSPEFRALGNTNATGGSGGRALAFAAAAA